MIPNPLTVDRGAPRAELEHLLEIGRVHHLPVVEGDRLVGLWVATGDRLELLGPESVLELPVDTEASRAFDSLVRGREAVLVRAGHQGVGVLTRTDVLDVVRLALAHGLGRRTAHPVVVRLTGPPGAGTTTLLARTLAWLRHCEAVVVMAHRDATACVEEGRLASARVLHAPEAGWRKSLYGWLEEVVPAQLALVEDKASLPYLGGAVMDDILVLVVPAGLEGRIAASALDRATAVAVTHLDVAPAGFDLATESTRLRSTNPELVVFGFATSDDGGLDEWIDWIERQVLPCRR